MRGDERFPLIWKLGPTVTSTIDVPRRAVPASDGKTTTMRFPDLAAAVGEEWKVRGSHRDSSDRRVDQVVLHTEDKTVFHEIAAVIDALYTPKRDFGGASKQLPAFNVTFAIN